MGLGGITFLKKMLRTEPRFKNVMKRASYSAERREERPTGEKGVGKGIEAGFDVVIVELMLRKYALLKQCRSIGDFAERWRNLAREQLDRFPNATTMVFLFDDETNVPRAKGKTQRKRRAAAGGETAGLTAEELVILGPYRYLCNSDPEEFDRRINLLFEGEANRRSYAGRTAVTAFEIFMNKHMRTAGLREDEFEFATRCIASGRYAGFNALRHPKRIIIDRGVWRRSYTRAPPSQDPHGGEDEPWRETVAPSLPSVERIPPLAPAIYQRAYDEIAEDEPSVSTLERLHVVAIEAFEVHGLRLGPTPEALAPHATAGRNPALIRRLRELHAAGGAGALPQAAEDQDPAARAWILMDVDGVRKIDGMDGEYIIGEADLKIRRYAGLFAGSSIFVVCHDTDLILILLLAVKDWVPRRGRCPGQLVLDMTTPSDVKKTPSLHGVVDVIELWRVVHAWFGESFPRTRNPVEVFCLLIILMGTDYLQNPPMLGPTLLWKAFSNKGLHVHLAEAVATDGHMGRALPPAEGRPADVVAELTRDLREAAFFDVELERCPAGHRVPYIEVYESAVVRFLLEAYGALKGRMADKWPPREWFYAQARRVAWQMAYWYQGDTLEGRVLDDEMAQDADGASVYGWHWVPDPDAPAAGGVRGGRAREVVAGCLGRRKLGGHVSEPAPAVVSAARFREIRQAARAKRCKKTMALESKRK